MIATGSTRADRVEMELDEVPFIPVIDQDRIQFAPDHPLVRARAMQVRIFGADDAGPLSRLAEDIVQKVIRGRRRVPCLIPIEIVQALPGDDALIGAIREILEVSKQGQPCGLLGSVSGRPFFFSVAFLRDRHS